MPYGSRGEGIEEIVFCRVGPATSEVVQFEDDAWPGEDRTYVVDEVEAALALAQRFAVEYGGEGAVVLVSPDGPSPCSSADGFQVRHLLVAVRTDISEFPAGA